MGDFIFAIVVTLITVMLPVINYSNGIDSTFFGLLFKVKLLYFIIIHVMISNTYIQEYINRILKSPSRHYLFIFQAYALFSNKISSSLMVFLVNETQLKT